MTGIILFLILCAIAPALAFMLIAGLFLIWLSGIIMGLVSINRRELKKTIK